jgi:hypothetical protein
MKFKTKYKICLWKGYFDKGLSLTSYVKYLIGFFALASLNIKLTLIIGFIYAICCFFLGWIWFRSGFIKAEIEVSNNFNLFVKEMRKKIVKPNNRKI